MWNNLKKSPKLLKNTKKKFKSQSLKKKNNNKNLQKLQRKK